MVEESIKLVVQNYIRAAREAGVNAQSAVVYGSHARGQAHEWSDIDLVVIVPEWDEHPSRAMSRILWGLRAKTDSRIEPIVCGPKEWETGDTWRPIIDVARKEGIMIAA